MDGNGFTPRMQKCEAVDLLPGSKHGLCTEFIWKIDTIIMRFRVQLAVFILLHKKQKIKRHFGAQWLSLQHPWPEFDSNYQIMFKVGMGEAPAVPDSLNEEGHQFLNLCLQHDPRQRSSASELLHHTFVKVSALVCTLGVSME